MSGERNRRFFFVADELVIDREAPVVFAEKCAVPHEVPRSPGRLRILGDELFPGPRAASSAKVLEERAICRRQLEPG